MRRSLLALPGLAPSLLRALLLVLAATVGCAGCARGPSAEERQLAQLRDEIGRVQADHDRFEQRLNKLELDAPARDNDPPPAAHPAAKGAVAVAVAVAVPMPTPRDLRVVHLGPQANGVDWAGAAPSGARRAASPETSVLNGEDPNDTTPRPTIRVQGGQTLPGARAARGRAERMDETLPPEAPNGGTTGPALGYVGQVDPVDAAHPEAGRVDRARPYVSALDPEAKRAYDAALALVTARRYPEALEAFAAFLVKWPEHPNADNAMYWRGESYLAQGEVARASEQFEGLVARFPLGNKVPDALLKLGICQQRLGNPRIAKTHFERLLREYPRSDAARRVPSLPESK